MRDAERELLLQLAVEYQQMAHSAVGLAMVEIARANGSCE
jgi:hypothetical protein